MTDSAQKLVCMLRLKPQAMAKISGSIYFPDISGTVSFRKTTFGTLVTADIKGLPFSYEPCASRFFGFHIHEGAVCLPPDGDAFSQTKSHYNPYDCLHPDHSGDLPPLLGNNGYSFQIFLTNSFDTEEIIGKTVVIHSAADDFTTQPSGNSGEKIACGEIKKIR